MKSTGGETIRTEDWSRASSAVKRILDVVVSLGAAIVFAPVCLAAACAIFLAAGRPILFAHERIGRDGVPFKMYKFRTMLPNNDDTQHRERNRRELAGEAEGDGGIFKDASDPRLTRVGLVLRRYSLDEIPQLYNVLAGDMSLVGPRPSLAWEVALFDEKFAARQRVRPGMTGLWQVSGRNLLDMNEMLALDVVYACTRSTLLDLKILAKTPLTVISGRGAT